MVSSRQRARMVGLICAGLAALAVLAPAASARAHATTRLNWKACAKGFECATARVPRDYAHPGGKKLGIAVTRLPARDKRHRIGSLFVNFGGPGADAVASLHSFGKDLFSTLNDRFDIVGFDPRGAGQNKPAIDCKVNQETQGLYGEPFFTPLNLSVKALVTRSKRYAHRCVRRNRAILPYVSTANVARDMNRLRAAVGDRKLTYLGFSYGTFLGATYASLFPKRYRALVLDGPVDADEYINHPTRNLQAQSAGFDRALTRFFMTCAAQQDVCKFGGADPWAAFDALVARAYRHPLPASGDHPRPVDGDDVLAAAGFATYAKQFWPLLAASLAMAAEGDGTGIRGLVDQFYGWSRNGYDPSGDRYFAITAVEQHYPRDRRFFLTEGARSWSLFPYTYWNTGYVELPYAYFPIKPVGVFRGPFRAARRATPPLVVATTYDPATPYRGALSLVAQLRRARLLTMVGDGHTAYGGNSRCIDAAVNAYLVRRKLPPHGALCRQEVPFAALQPAAAGGGASRGLLRSLQPRLALVR
jgi:pimeloyl-ACP methyl ester carboxylesterase